MVSGIVQWFCGSYSTDAAGHRRLLRRLPRLQRRQHQAAESAARQGRQAEETSRQENNRQAATRSRHLPTQDEPRPRTDAQGMHGRYRPSRDHNTSFQYYDWWSRKQEV